MSEINFPQVLSILPPLVAIAVVLWRKEVIGALILAVLSSELLLLFKTSGDWSPFQGLISSIERVVSVFSSPGNARLLLFSMLVGALLGFMRFSGGVNATVRRMVNSGVASTRAARGLMTFSTGVVVFLESNLSVLTSGILSRGLFDRFKMSRERLAYIIDSTSAPVCILIFLNGWGAFVMGLVAPYDIGVSPAALMLSAAMLNVYAISTLLLVFYTVWSGRVFGPLAAREAELSNGLATSPNQQRELTENEDSAGRAKDMLLPLAVMVVSMLGFMWWTGDGDILKGSGTKSVLYATVIALLVAYVLLISQPRFTHQRLIHEGFNGTAEILPLVSILLLSIAMGASVREMGTGEFIAGLVSDYLPLWTVPAIVFIAGAFASFTTGTSWGTFALMVPIAMPIAIELNMPPELMLAAVLGGGIFGDHCSPVSDTTAVSSLAAGCDLLDHVRTQLPYALVCGAITIIAYVLLGIMYS